MIKQFFIKIPKQIRNDSLNEISMSYIEKCFFSKTSILSIVNGLFICYFYKMNNNYRLQSTDDLTKLIKQNQITNWKDLTLKIKHLPYGRNANRTDLALVWKEQKGTCSSKHAFLKHVADLNKTPNIELTLGMYKMNQSNTPKIGNVLSKHKLDYIPEAHCYLKIEGKPLDFTSKHSDFKTIENDILLEKIITPQQVSEFKVAFHKAYIKEWITTNNIPYSFETIWDIREQCITNLSS